MKYHLEDSDISMIDRVSNITDTQYLFNDKDYIEVDTLLDIISDLEDKYISLQEEQEEYKEKIKNEYEPKKYDPYLDYGVSESDFH